MMSNNYEWEIKKMSDQYDYIPLIDIPGTDEERAKASGWGVGDTVVFQNEGNERKIAGFMNGFVAISVDNGMPYFRSDIALYRKRVPKPVSVVSVEPSIAVRAYFRILVDDIAVASIGRIAGREEGSALRGADIDAINREAANLIAQRLREHLAGEKEEEIEWTKYEHGRHQTYQPKGMSSTAYEHGSWSIAMECNKGIDNGKAEVEAAIRAVLKLRKEAAK